MTNVLTLKRTLDQLSKKCARANQSQSVLIASDVESENKEIECLHGTYGVDAGTHTIFIVPLYKFGTSTQDSLYRSSISDRENCLSSLGLAS